MFGFIGITVSVAALLINPKLAHAHIKFEHCSSCEPSAMPLSVLSNKSVESDTKSYSSHIDLFINPKDPTSESIINQLESVQQEGVVNLNIWIEIDLSDFRYFTDEIMIHWPRSFTYQIDIKSIMANEQGVIEFPTLIYKTEGKIQKYDKVDHIISKLNSLLIK